MGINWKQASGSPGFLEFDSPLTDKNSPFRAEMEKDFDNFIRWHLKDYKLLPSFPKAKYVSVSKTYESDETYILRGNSRRCRRYSIGIMTTDNHFYYNTIKTKQNGFSRNSIPLVHNIFLRPYNYDAATSVAFSSKIRNFHEPIHIFFSIVQGLMGTTLHYEPLRRKAAMVNVTYRCLPGKNKISDFGKCMVKPCIRHLYEMGALAFAERRPDVIETLKKYIYDGGHISECLGVVETLISILYLQCKDMRHKESTREKIERAVKNLGRITEQELLERTLSEKLEAGEKI